MNEELRTFLDAFEESLVRFERRIAAVQRDVNTGFAAAHERLSELGKRTERIDRLASKSFHRTEDRLQRIEDHLHIEALEYIE
ncbi:MAG: hypothetical protein AAFN13_06375 [Bacteroidota bacterium]